jgi:hypothetical protein
MTCLTKTASFEDLEYKPRLRYSVHPIANSLLIDALMNLFRAETTHVDGWLHRQSSCDVSAAAIFRSWQQESSEQEPACRNTNAVLSLLHNPLLFPSFRSVFSFLSLGVFLSFICLISTLVPEASRSLVPASSKG